MNLSVQTLKKWYLLTGKSNTVYAEPSMVRAIAKVSFRFRLLGYDPGWVSHLFCDKVYQFLNFSVFLNDMQIIVV